MDKEEFLILAQKYSEETGFMSVMHSMKETESFKELIKLGDDAIPYIIDMFRNKQYSMSWTLVLMTITNLTPMQPKSVGAGMGAWNVESTCKAWIDWHDSQNTTQ